MIKPPALSPGQEQSWIGVLDLAAARPKGWVLVGGQMVQLHCWERGAHPSRPTDDADLVADVRGTTWGLRELTATLQTIGFRAVGETAGGREHRWERGEAVIDVLTPRYIGHFADRFSITGAKALMSPGAQRALDRRELVEVEIGGRVGVVARPSLLGAIVGKAAAYVVLHDDKGKDRHLTDFATLASLIGGRRDLADNLSKLETRRLRSITSTALIQRSAWATIEGAEEGIGRLRARYLPDG